MLRFLTCKEYVRIIVVLILIQTGWAGENEFYSYNWGYKPDYLMSSQTDSIIQLKKWNIKTEKNQWQEITLPFFSAQSQDIYLKCSFFIPDEFSEKIRLISHGIHGTAQIYLNGSLIHFQSNNYVPFQIELKKGMLKSDQPNEIQFHLQHPKTANSGFPEYVHLFSERKRLGITRPVYISLDRKNYIHSLRANITSISTKASIAYSYQIHLSPDILKESKKLRLEETFLNKHGKILNKRVQIITPEKLNITGKFQLSPDYLWSPDHPEKVYLNINLKERFTSILRCTIPAGFRKLTIKAGKLYLNNKPVQIRGINYYENLESIINENYFKTTLSDLLSIKNMGFNAIRFPHYAPDKMMAHIADSLGILLFAELPIWRYPPHLYLNDNLLENSKSTIQNLGRFFNTHPSLAGISIGQEIPLHEASTQKFMLILKGSVSPNLNMLTYLSPIPGKPLAPEKSADFYILDLYQPLQSFTKLNQSEITPYLLGGKIGIVRNKDVYQWDQDPSNMKRQIFLTREIQTALKNMKLQGGFIESYSDWKSAFATCLTIEDSNKTIMPTGLYSYNRQPKHWIKNIDNVWDLVDKGTLTEQKESRKTNFFSIVMFFATVIFFAIYRQRPRMRENLKRAIKHPYGFFVDMRERRIIPIFNSFMISVYASLILATYIGSYFYYYSDSYGTQEILSIFLIPLGIFDNYLSLSRLPATITLGFFILFFMYPVFVSIILKIISIFSGERIRYRQGLAIGLWSGVPLIFMAPLSLISYQLLYYSQYETFMLYILLFFIVWTHYRIINGIRVLFVTRLGKVFIIILLSYIIPFIIFWAVFKPEPYWYEYLNLLLNARNLF